MGKHIQFLRNLLVIAMAGIFLFSNALADTLIIPAGVRKIEKEAFYGDALDEVILPEGIEEIGERAFAESNLKKINLPSSLKADSIAEDAIDPGVQVTAEKGTEAYQWAVENGFLSDREVFEYEPNDDFYGMGCTLVRYNGTDSIVEIPARNDSNQYVTRIGESAFRENSYIERVIITDWVTRIEENAFQDCENLEWVNRADTNDFDEEQHLIGHIYAVQYIGDYAFCNCSNLKIDLSNVKEIGRHALIGIGQVFAYVGSDGAKAISRTGMPFSVQSDRKPVGCDLIYQFDEEGQVSGLLLEDVDNGVEFLDIPGEITAVNPHAFINCTKLKSIYINSGSDTLKVESGILFSKDGKQLIASPLKRNATEPYTYTIPDGVEEIAPYAFADCSMLKELTVPQSLRVIGDHALVNCSSLTELRFKRGLTHIGSEAFSGCTSLQVIWLPDTIETFGSGLFEGCSALSSVYFPEEHEARSQLVEYGYAGKLKYWDGLCNYDYMYEENGDGTCTLVSYSGNEEHIRIPYVGNTGFLITVIGQNAFRGKNMLSVIIPDSVTEIRDNAFMNCTALTSIALPSNLERLGGSAFNSCFSLTKLYLPDSLTHIGSFAFTHSGIHQIVLPPNWTEVDTGSYSGEIINSNSLTSPFYRQENMAIRIPNGCTQLPYKALEYCDIEALYVPESMTFANVIYSPLGDGCEIQKVYGIAGSEGENWANNHNIPFTTDPWPYDDVDPHTVIKHVDEPLYDSEDGSNTFEMRFGAAASAGDVYTLKIETSGSWSVRNPCPWVTIEESQMSGSGNGTVVLHVNSNVTYEAMTGSILITAGGKTITGNIRKGAWEAGLATSVEGTVFELSERRARGTTVPDIQKLPLQGVTVKILGRDDQGYYTIQIDQVQSDANGRWSSPLIGPTKPYLVKVQMDGYDFGQTQDYLFIAKEGVNITPNAYGVIENGSIQALIDEENGDMTGIAPVSLGDFTVIQNADGSYKTIKYNGNDTSLTLPEGVTEIGSETFKDSSVRNVRIPYGVTRIGDSAFNRCYRLAEISIPESVTYIGKSAFESCISLRKAEIKGTPDLDENAFSGCSNLGQVIVSNYLPNLFYGAFSQCSALIKAPLTSGTNTIGEFAFSGCDSLTNVEIPDTVTTIKNSAFYNCKGLKAVTIPATVTEFGIGVFEKDDALQKIYVTEGSAAFTVLQQEEYSDKLIIEPDPANVIDKLELGHGLTAEFFEYNKWFSGRPETFMNAENKRAEETVSNVDFCWIPVVKAYNSNSILGGQIHVEHKALESYHFEGTSQGMREEGLVLYVPEKFGVKMNGYLQIDPAEMDRNDDGTVAIRVRGDNGVMLSLQQQESNESSISAKDWDSGSNNVAECSRRVIVGQVYALEINHYSNGGEGKLILEYNPASSGSPDYNSAWRVIPSGWLYQGKRQVWISGQTELQTVYAMRMDSVSTSLKNYTHETWKEILGDMVSDTIGSSLVDSSVSKLLGVGSDYLNGMDSSVDSIRKKLLDRFKIATKDKLVSTLCDIFTDKLAGDETYQSGNFFAQLWDTIAEELETTVDSIIPHNYSSLKSDLEKYLVIRQFLENKKQMNHSTTKLDLITSLLSFSDYDHRHEGYALNPEASVETLLFMDMDTQEKNAEMQQILSGSEDVEDVVDFASKAYKLITDLKDNVDKAAATLNLLYAERGLNWFNGVVNLVGHYSSGSMSGLSAFESALNLSIRAGGSEAQMAFLLESHIPYLTGKQCAQILAADQYVSLDHLLYKELLLMALDATKSVYKSVLK